MIALVVVLLLVLVQKKISIERVSLCVTHEAMLMVFILIATPKKGNLIIQFVRTMYEKERVMIFLFLFRRFTMAVLLNS